MGHEAKAEKVLTRMAKKLIHDMHYEARVGCVVKFYAIHRNTRLKKKDARDIHMSRAQYLKVASHIICLLLSSRRPKGPSAHMHLII